ncbi:DIM/SIM/IMP family subclass B1 metallo-beta-lactamase [Aliikangiella coralliicola]|uniref:beta-lactamase n=1 Tax=Aliikangiella coralliicola TaxID=2592383 RepID=A0A545UFT5_9GAMM|nr:DIM/SIM/IMP family subclass B1 metallo-beta-lactamase [Aliikangiella coralliicola]TQV88331.1 DIM/SIM/IMP family subclass B1 metallo-beta-lactamase [Aliikangiella coralliicola]
MKYILALLLIVSANFSYAGDETPKLKIKLLQPNVYLHTSYQFVDGFGMVGSNGLIVLSGSNAFIVDTPWSDADTKSLMKWIQERGYFLKGSISTHSHEDRTAGIRLLNEHKIPTYASKLTNEILSKSGKATAKNSIDSESFWLEKELIEVFYPGGGHAIDNVVVWLPKSQILFGGCLVRSAASRSLGYVGEAAIDSWPSSVQKLVDNYPTANLVVPGHGAVGDKKLLSHTISLAQQAAKKSKISKSSE